MLVLFRQTNGKPRSHFVKPKPYSYSGQRKKSVSHTSVGGTTTLLLCAGKPSEMSRRIVYSLWDNVKHFLDKEKESIGSEGAVQEGKGQCTVEPQTKAVSRAPHDSLKPASPVVPPTDLIHVAQQESWDCGVACLVMVWAWLATPADGLYPSRADIEEVRNALLSVIDTQSIWTIDLVYALDQIYQQTSARLVKFEFNFFSNMLEANTEWAGFAYYETAFDEDQRRTAQRFRSMQLGKNKQRVHLLKAETSLDWIVESIQIPNSVAILLIDKSVLQGAAEGEESTTMEQSSASNYAGHYVIVTGVASVQESDQANNHLNDEILLVVHDPDRGMNHVPKSLLQRAWKAPGTDHDVVLVRKIGKGGG